VRFPRSAAIALAILAAAAVGLGAGLLTSRDSNPPTSSSRAATTEAVPAWSSTVVPEERPARGAPRDRRAELPPDWIDRRALRAGVQRAIAAGGGAGVFVRSLGDQPPAGAGALQTGPAWSTIKIPIVIARYRVSEGAEDRALDGLASSAITASDNAAAATLFDGIAAAEGGVPEAARFVDDVLADGGDHQTRVNAVKVRPEFSAYGQTAWGLEPGTAFFSALERGCVDPPRASDRVNEWMTQVVADQRWGLGRAPVPPGSTVAFKGGWGPDVDGRYVGRQFGVVARPDGRGIAVGLIAQSPDGSFAGATRVLDELASAVAETVRWRRLEAPAACQSG
jgi:hypothetical protein